MSNRNINNCETSDAVAVYLEPELVAGSRSMRSIFLPIFTYRHPGIFSSRAALRKCISVSVRSLVLCLSVALWPDYSNPLKPTVALAFLFYGSGGLPTYLGLKALDKQSRLPTDELICPPPVTDVAELSMNIAVGTSKYMPLAATLNSAQQQPILIG